MIKIYDHELELDKNPDNSLIIPDTLYGYIGDNILYRQAVINWYFESMDEVFVVYNIAKHLADNTYNKVALSMPYIPYQKSTHTDGITFKYLAKIINACKFQCITTYDPINPNLLISCIDRIVINYPTTPIFRVVGRIMDDFNIESSDDVILLFSTNTIFRNYKYGLYEGAPIYNHKICERAGDDLDQIFTIPEHDTDSYEEKYVLLITNFMVTGEEYKRLAALLKQHGCKGVFLYASHTMDGIKQSVWLKSDLIDHIYTTDSLLKFDHDKITKMQCQLGATIFTDRDFLSGKMSDVEVNS